LSSKGEVIYRCQPEFIVPYFLILQNALSSTLTVASLLRAGIQTVWEIFLWVRVKIRIKSVRFKEGFDSSVWNDSLTVVFQYFSAFQAPLSSWKVLPRPRVR